MKQTRRPDPLLLISAVLLLAGFFLNWIDVRLWGLLRLTQTNGLGMPVLIDDLFEGEYPLWLLRSIYLIPALALLLLVAELRQLRGVSFLAGAGLVVVTVFWLAMVFILTGKVESQVPLVEMRPLKVLETGYYLTVIGVLYPAARLLRGGR